MTQILHLTCSPRGDVAESSKLSRRIVEMLLRAHPAATIVKRDIGGGLPSVDAAYAISQGSAADVSQDGSMILSEELVHELESSQVVVIGTPMHNLTVPSALKAWLDHVVRARRTFNVTAAGKVGTLVDRPVFVAIASGGRFSGERARQPDFLTPYLRAIFGIVGIHNLTFFSIEGTGAGAEAILEGRVRAEDAINEHFALPVR